MIRPSWKELLLLEKGNLAVRFACSAFHHVMTQLGVVCQMEHLQSLYQLLLVEHPAELSHSSTQARYCTKADTRANLSS